LDSVRHLDFSGGKRQFFRSITRILQRAFELWWRGILLLEYERSKKCDCLLCLYVGENTCKNYFRTDELIARGDFTRDPPFQRHSSVFIEISHVLQNGYARFEIWHLKQIGV